MTAHPAIQQCFAHEFRRTGKPVRTIHLLAPREVREAAELARLDEASAEAQAERTTDGRQLP